MPALNGWHPGERQIQHKLGLVDQVATLYTQIQGDIPPQHAQFYETCLPFIPVTLLDDDGRPWGSILAGKDGKKGNEFVHSRHHTKLDVKARSWAGDPLLQSLQQKWQRDEKVLIAGIGVEFETRRRNKFAGFVSELRKCEKGDIEMELVVNEAIGNCPKYINVRDLEPCANSGPDVVYDHPSLSPEDRLPDDTIDFVLARDTVFLGTSYVSPPETAERFPSHVGMNHRGGLSGFVRVRRDGRTLVLPDYSGNRMMTSLGNIECTPLASLTFVDFSTGDILYLTGTAKNVVGREAHDIMPFTNALTVVHTTGYIFVRNALPVRQKEGTINKPSPYSPPVRRLAEEASMSIFGGDDRPDALLTSIVIRSEQVATFKWESSKDLEISPGQAIILDCSTLLGTRQYQHMAPLNPISVNDDRIRTWTVSSASTTKGLITRTFSITLRHKVGGALTTAFFAIAQKLEQMRGEMLTDTRPLGLTVKIAGVTGDFTLPQSLSPSPPPGLAWFAGGIGITPFLSMLESLRKRVRGEETNVHLVLSARDATTMLQLVYEKYNGEDSTPNPNVHLTVDVFHSLPDAAMRGDPTSMGVVVRPHPRRLDAAYIIEEMKEKFDGKDVYICGPDDYMLMVIEAVRVVGVNPDRIHSEGFSY